MKPIHPTAWLSIALLTLCLLANNAVAQVADLSKAPVSITLSNGIVFKLFGLAKAGKSIFPEGGFSDESMRSLFANAPIADKDFPLLDYRVSLYLICWPAPPRELNNPNSLYYKWVDENGYESLSVGRPTEWSGNFKGNEEVKAIVFNIYPSRSRVMKLRIYSRSGLHGEVSLRNPFPTDIAPWPEAALPQEQRLKDVTVKLVEATCRMEPAPNWNPIEKGLIKPWTELKLQIYRQGQMETNWSTQSISASDATGNSINEIRLHGAADSVRHYDLLWPVEPIRYRVGLLREAHFPADEYVELKGLAVPRNERTAEADRHNEALTKINFKTNLLGAKIEFIGFDYLFPKMGVPYEGDFSALESKIGDKLKKLSGVKGEIRVLVFGKTDFDPHKFKVFLYDERNGAEIKVEEGFGGQSKTAFLTFIPETTKSLTLRIALQKPIYVEFTTRPKIVGDPPEPLIK